MQTLRSRPQQNVKVQEQHQHSIDYYTSSIDTRRGLVEELRNLHLYDSTLLGTSRAPIVRKGASTTLDAPADFSLSHSKTHKAAKVRNKFDKGGAGLAHRERRGSTFTPASRRETAADPRQVT